MEQLKKGRGGRRIGAGRKSMYAEGMTSISFRVPASAKETIRQMVRNYLSTLVIERKNHEIGDGC
jgi:hypothetical protein